MNGGTRLFSVVASWARAPGASPHEPCGVPGLMVDRLLEKAGSHHQTLPGTVWRRVGFFLTNAVFGDREEGGVAGALECL